MDPKTVRYHDRIVSSYQSFEERTQCERVLLKNPTPQMDRAAAMPSESCKAPSSQAGLRSRRTRHSYVPVVERRESKADFAGPRRPKARAYKTYVSVSRKNPTPLSRRAAGGESACKPGSVLDNHSSGPRVASRPQATNPKTARATPLFSYLVLLRVGFTLPRLLPAARCALTAPFHPYQPRLAVYFLLHWP